MALHRIMIDVNLTTNQWRDQPMDGADVIVWLEDGTSTLGAFADGEWIDATGMAFRHRGDVVRAWAPFPKLFDSMPVNGGRRIASGARHLDPARRSSLVDHAESRRTKAAIRELEQKVTALEQQLQAAKPKAWQVFVTGSNDVYRHADELTAHRQANGINKAHLADSLLHPEPPDQMLVIATVSPLAEGGAA